MGTSADERSRGDTQAICAKLGEPKIGKSCLYTRRLREVDQSISK